MRMNTVYRDGYMNTSMSQEKSSTVFISYSWAEKECGCDWVVGLANRLRSDGIDADIDMYHESPAEGWTTWIINKYECASCKIELQEITDIISQSGVDKLLLYRG